MRADGARRLTFPEGQESNQNACFSPDGSFLVFTRFDEGYNDGPAHIYRLDLSDDAEPIQLTHGDYDDVNVPFGCFDQSTGRVIFASDRSEASDFWTIDPVPDNPDLNRLTRHGELPVWIEPVYSPDGEQIAFESNPIYSRKEAEQRAEVFTLDTATQTPNQLTNLDGDLDDRLPSWSPDGTRILYQHRDPDWSESLDHWEAWVIEPNGSGSMNISALAEVEERGPDTDLSWMPDGRHILTSTNPGGTEHPNIFLLAIDGGPLIRVTNSEDFEDGAACASPDGLSVAFESHRIEDEDSPSDIWVVDTPPEALAVSR